MLKNDIEITAFPWELRIPELIIKQEKQKPDGLYVMMDKEEMVKLYDIKTINVIRDCDEFKANNISEPMYGYKAIPEINGKLQAKGYEYRLNTPCKNRRKESIYYRLSGVLFPFLHNNGVCSIVSR